MKDEAAKKVIAWCPDDTDESGALEYSGRTPGEVAEAHAEFLHGRGDPCESYDIRVRITSGGQVREWDVCVDVEMVVSFHASIAFPVAPGKAADATVEASS